MMYIDIIRVEHTNNPSNKRWSVKLYPGLGLVPLNTEPTTKEETDRLIEFLSTRVFIRTIEDVERELHNRTRKSDGEDRLLGGESDQV